MLLSRIIKRNAPRVTEMYLQFNLPLVFEKFSTLQKTPYHHLLKNQSFYNSRPCYVSRGVGVSASNPPVSSVAARITRTARIEAEEVLFDYLHCTRALQYTDAEHISKNCPSFVENLLSKVKDDQEITQSLSRYFRYNPINEFEPFFESLGLAQFEVPPLLSRDMMFLSDDELMLENYHVLSNYGIPRSRIGKMYKEEKEVFGYNYGVLASKLRAYEGLSLCKSTVVKLVSCCPSLLVGDVNEDFVGVVGKLKGLGIESSWIAEHLSDGTVYNWSRMLELICFLEKMGSRKDMGKLLKTNPHFLIEDYGKKVYVLVSMFLKVGLKMDDVLILFIQYPKLLAGKFVENLWQAVQFLSEVGMETEDIAKIVRAHTQIFGNSTLKKPATVLSHLNVEPDRLCEIIKEDPVNFISLASKWKPKVKKVGDERGGHLVEKTTFLQSIGYLENSEEMVKALKQFRGRGDQLHERFDCLVNAGLDCHVVAKMIKGAPPVLNQSKDVIEMKIKYLVNHFGFPLKSIEGFPTYLCYSIEKIKLRFSMYVWLREKGVVKPMMALSSILAISEARFLKYYVNVHPEGPAQWEKLKKSSS